MTRGRRSATLEPDGDAVRFFAFCFSSLRRRASGSQLCRPWLADALHPSRGSDPRSLLPGGGGIGGITALLGQLRQCAPGVADQRRLVQPADRLAKQLLRLAQSSRRMQAMPARYCSRASRGLRSCAASMRESQGASSVLRPSSSVCTSRRRRCSSRPRCGSAAGVTIRSQAGSSQPRARFESPFNAAMRCAAAIAISGIARSASSSECQTRSNCAVSCAPAIRSVARPRTRLCAASPEKARCLASSRAVSSASSVRRASRAALSLTRSASVRRAAPCGSSSSQASAACASRSSSAQRAAHSWMPSRDSRPSPAWRWPGSFNAAFRCSSRAGRSCSACAPSAASRCDSMRSCGAFASRTPLSDSIRSCSIAASAERRARRKRPASRYDSPSSSAACMARSFCCMRQRRACRGRSSSPAIARSAT